MANHIQNDRGEWVIACGADGSIARVQYQYPELIKDIAYVMRQGYMRVDTSAAYEFMLDRGIDKTWGITRKSLIYAAAEYNKEQYLINHNLNYGEM